MFDILNINMHMRAARPQNFYLILGTLCVLHVTALLVREFQDSIPLVSSQHSSSMQLKLINEFPQNRVAKPQIKKIEKTIQPKVIEKKLTETETTKPVTTERFTGSTVTQNDVKLLYLGELRELIDSRKVYPLQARRLGQTGIVEITFTLTADGHIMNARISQASPYQRLNEAALATVNEIRHFRPIPREIGEESMTVKVPMRYSKYQ
jgi:TonB family protein